MLSRGLTAVRRLNAQPCRSSVFRAWSATAKDADGGIEGSNGDDGAVCVAHVSDADVSVDGGAVSTGAAAATAGSKEKHTAGMLMLAQEWLRAVEGVSASDPGLARQMYADGQHLLGHLVIDGGGGSSLGLQLSASEANSRSHHQAPFIRPQVGVL